MTRDAILEKLTDILNTPPRDGRDVIYGLVKIRKMIEHDAQASYYWVLRFFCDWALHTKLTRDLAQRIMTILDERLGHHVQGAPESLDSDGMAWELFSFTLFVRQLLDFFQQHGLPKVWVEDWSTWQRVCALYGDVAANRHPGQVGYSHSPP